MRGASIGNKKNCSLCSNKKSFQKLDEHARVYAAFFLDHEPHVPFRCNRRNQTKAVASTGRLDDGRFALLAPCTPRVMIRTHVGDRKNTRLNSSHVGISYAVFR